MGELVETAPRPRDIIEGKARDPRTTGYIEGRFG